MQPSPTLLRFFTAFLLLCLIIPASTPTPTAAAFSVSPAQATLPFGERVVFSAGAPSATWSIVRGGGSVSPDGLFSAPVVSDTVTLRATSAVGFAEATIAVRAWAPVGAAPLPPKPINSLVFGRDGRLYAAVDGSGVYAMDPREGSYWQPLRMSGVENSGTIRVNAMTVDDAGSLYIATGRGVYRRDAGASFWVALSEGLPEAQQSAEWNALLWRGGVLYGGQGGTVYRWTGGAWAQVGAAKPTDNDVLSFAFDASGRLYAGAQTVYRYDNPGDLGGAWAKLENGLPGELVGSMAWHNGTLYAALRNKGIYAFDGTRWTLSNERGGMLLVVGGELFAGGSPFNGTVVIKRVANGWQPITSDMGAITLGGVNQLIADDQGVIYVAKANEGVYRSARGVAPGSKPPANTDRVSITPSDLTLRVGTNAFVVAGISSETSAPVGTLRLYLPLIRGGGAVGVAADKGDGVYWLSADSSIATVDGRGVVTGVAVGSTTFTAIARADSSTRATAVVTVTDAAPQITGVSIAEGASATVAVSRALALHTSVAGRDFGDKPGVIWTSSNPALATVSANGIVTGVAVGSVTVTAAAQADPVKQAMISVTVVPSNAAALPNGGAWQNITTNLPENPKFAGQTASVRALTFYGGKLYAGTEAGGIWRYNGTTWNQVGQNGTGAGQLGPYSPTIADFAVDGNDTLYALSIRQIMRYDGDNNWTNLSTGLPPSEALQFLRNVNGMLYVLVSTSAGSQMHRFDGTRWAAVGGVLSGPRDIIGLVYASGAFYAGGSDGKVYAMPLAGGAWTDFSSGLAQPPAYDSRDTGTAALTAAPDGTLYVIVDRARNKLYRRAPGEAAWSPIISYAYGQGVGYSGTVIGDALYLGGGTVIKVRGTTQTKLGANVGSALQIRVYAIASPDGGKTIYAGGSGDTLGHAVYMIAPDPQAPAQDSNLDVTTASYLGNGTGADALNAADIAPDGSVIVAGLSERAADAGPLETLWGVVPTNLLGGGAGVVARLDATGRTVRSATRLGDEIDDMEVDRTSGRIAVASDLGVTLLSASADRVVWHQPLTNTTRVAVGNDGTVAALSGATVWVWSASGALLGTKTLTNSYVTDVAVDAVSGSVFVVGFDNRRLPYGEPVQVAFLYSFSYDLSTRKWVNWGFDGAALEELTAADTRLYRVAIGHDGKLYALGENAGGNSIFQRDPRDPNVTRATVQYDIYNQPVQTRSAHFAYYARLEPDTGALLGAQLAIPRLPDGTSNTFRARAITADEQGYIYVTGTSAFIIENRDLQHIAGQQVAPYKGGDSALLVVAPDFRTRMRWTVWTAGGNPNHNTTIGGVAAAQGIAAIAASSDQGTLITAQPIAGGAGPSPALRQDNPDGFVSVWHGYAGR